MRTNREYGQANAAMVMESLKRCGVNTLVKQCHSHVYRAVDGFRRKPRKALPTEVQEIDLSETPIMSTDIMTSVFIEDMLSSESLPRVFVHMAVMIALFETERLNTCSPIMMGAEPQIASSDDVKQQATTCFAAMQRFIDGEVAGLQFASLAEATAAAFSAGTDAWLTPFEAVVDRAVPLVTHYGGRVYLESLDNASEGILHCNIFYGPRSTKKVVVSMGKTLAKTPNSKSYRFKGKLPFDGTIRNPACSKRAAQYLRKTWAKTAAFWAAPVLTFLRHLVGVAMDNSNQAMEARIKDRKHNTSIHDHCKDLGQYILYWYRTQVVDDGATLEEMKNFDRRLRDLLDYRGNKRQRVEVSGKSLTLFYFRCRNSVRT